MRRSSHRRLKRFMMSLLRRKPLGAQKLRTKDLSSSWDLIDEAHAYLPARRNYPELRFFGHIGELSPTRVHNVLSAAPPLNPHGPITAVIHFNPRLITEGLGENGPMN